MGGLALRIRNIALVSVLSLGLPAALITQPAYGQAAQPTAQELYNSGMELFKAGELKQAQDTLRKVDPLQLPRDLQPTFYNTLFEIDQQLNAPDTPAPKPVVEPEANPEPQPAPLPEPEVVKPDAASLLRQADVLAAKSPAEALSLYQQVAADLDADDQQKATAAARIAGIERRLNGDVTSARKLIALAEQDIINSNLDAAQAKLTSVKNSGVELGFFDSESVSKKLALIAEVRASNEALAKAQEQVKPEPVAVVDPQPKPEPNPAEAAKAAELKAQLADAQARAAEAEAKLAAMQRKINEQQEQPVIKGAPVSDLMSQARANTAAEKAAEGDTALRNGQLAAAVKLYEDATLLDPENESYKTKLSEAQGKLNDQVRPLSLIDRSNEDLIIDRKRAVAEYESAMEKAGQALDNLDFLAANDQAIQARTILTTSKGLFDTAEYNERTARATFLQNQIQETRRRVEAQEAIKIEADRKVREAQIAEETRERKAEEIQNRLRSARALQLEGKYDEALAELDTALFSDPNNPVLRGLRDMIQDTAIVVKNDELRRLRDVANAKQSLINIEATTPYDDIMVYPGEWPELTAMRMRGLDTDNGESETNRAAQAALRKIVTLSNDNLSLDQVIAFIRDTTGANIAVNWPALELVGIDQDSLVTISLNRVPAEQLLRLVLDQVSADAFDDDKAGFSISEGIIKISTLRDLKTETETRVYDIRDLLVQVPNFTNAPGFDLNDALSNTSSGGSNGGGGGGGGRGGGGGGGGGGLFGDSNDSQQSEELPTRQELVDQITELIRTTVGDPDEWLDEESTLTELNGNMIIKTTGDNHRQIMGLLGRLRETRAVQISVEARFLTVERNFLDEFRLDLDVTFNAFDLDTDADGINDAHQNPGNWSPIVVGNNSNALAGRPSTSVGNRFSDSAENAFGIGAQFLDDIQVDFLLQATQANEHSVALTAPRVTFFNGQRAYVMVATQTAFVSDLEPIPDAIGFDPTVSVITTGIVLDVEGTISSDRRYVTLTLRPSLANLVALSDFSVGGAGTINNGTGNPTVITVGGTIQVPEIQITQVRSTVSVPDRGTLLTGGQRLVGEVETEVGVPVLSKIPVVNRLFTNTSTASDERTLLILVRPTIIIQSEQEDILFPGLNENPQDYNIGTFGS